MDVVREDKQVVGVTEKDAEDGERWRRVIRCDNSLKREGKAEKGRQTSP